MPTEIPATTVLASQGTSGPAATLAGVGTGLKAFVVAHPVTLAAVAGILLGIAGYYAVDRFWKKPEETGTGETAAV